MGVVERELARKLGGGAGGELPGLPGLGGSAMATPMPGVGAGSGRRLEELAERRGRGVLRTRRGR
jgi:hypothetical protein